MSQSEHDINSRPVSRCQTCGDTGVIYGSDNLGDSGGELPDCPDCPPDPPVPDEMGNLDISEPTQNEEVMDTITIEEALEIMAAHKYDDDQKARLRAYHDDGRRVIIFQNEDFGHSALGHVIAMPWSRDEELPPHGPDHPTIGLGWRYRTKFVVEPKLSIVEDLGGV